MWTAIIEMGLGYGQQNTATNQANELQDNQQLASVLFRNRKNNEQLFVIMSMMLIVGVIIFVVAKGK